MLGFYFFEIRDGIGDLIRDWYLEQMVRYESPELTLLRTGYETLSFPFPRLEVPPLSMRVQWKPTDLEAFLRQWIVAKRARDAGRDVISPLMTEVNSRWSAEERREVRWPLFVLATRF